MKKNLGFADFALFSSLKYNRSLKLMDKISQSIDWTRSNAVLMRHYTVGTSGEGADARHVKSNNRPLSNDQLKEVRDQRNTPEGKLDKNGNVHKFSRDFESN